MDAVVWPQISQCMSMWGLLFKDGFYYFQCYTCGYYSKYSFCACGATVVVVRKKYGIFHESTKLYLESQSLEGEYLERILPLGDGLHEWGSGKVLVTTSNAGVIPQKTTTIETVGIDPLSIEESAELVGLLAGYSLSEREKESLKAMVDKKQWRCLPLVMVG